MQQGNISLSSFTIERKERLVLALSNCFVAQSGVCSSSSIASSVLSLSSLDHDKSLKLFTIRLINQPEELVCGDWRLD